MGFNVKNLIGGKEESTQEVTTGNQDLQKLTKEEIQFLLSMIKQSTFQGEAVEMLYKLVLKLQNQYLNIK